MASTTRRRRSRYDFAPQWLTRKRMLLGSLAVVVLIVGTYGTRLALSLGAFTHQNPISALFDIIKGKGGSDVQKQIDSLDRINIVLYGYGGPGHDGPYLTDSILVVSIQPRAGAAPQIAEVSVPRDWYVPIDLGGSRPNHARVNEAFQDGYDGKSSLPRGTDSGAKIANTTLEKVLGIHINHYVGVDFTAFQSGVDAVGGVDVDVATSFSDHQYPRGECGSDGRGDCAYKTVRFRAGRQHMDGATALVFSRSRHSQDPGEGTDFARSRRQQLVLQALKSKVASVGGLGHLPDLLNALSDHVTTDLKIGDAQALYDLVKGVDHAAISRVSLDGTNFLYDCGFPSNCPAAYLYAHDDSFGSVGRFLGHLFPSPDVIGEHAPIAVADASGTGAGASTRWSTLLTAIGLGATDAGPLRSRPATHIIDDSGGHYPKTAAWLADYFGVAVEPGKTTSAATSGGIRLMLGQDEERVFNASSGSSDTSGSSDPSGSSNSSGSSGDSSGSPSPSRSHARSPAATSPRSTSRSSGG